MRDRFEPPRQGDDDAPQVPHELLAQVGAALSPSSSTPRTSSTAPTPPDKGLVLAEIERGAEGSLVLAWATYEGKPYLNLRVWSRDGWPQRGKGVSIRLRELEPLLRGLLAAERKRRTVAP